MGLQRENAARDTAPEREDARTLSDRPRIHIGGDEFYFVPDAPRHAGGKVAGQVLPLDFARVLNGILLDQPKGSDTTRQKLTRYLSRIVRLAKDAESKLEGPDSELLESTRAELGLRQRKGVANTRKRALNAGRGIRAILGAEKFDEINKALGVDWNKDNPIEKIKLSRVHSAQSFVTASLFRRGVPELGRSVAESEFINLCNEVFLNPFNQEQVDKNRDKIRAEAVERKKAALTRRTRRGAGRSTASTAHARTDEGSGLSIRQKLSILGVATAGAVVTAFSFGQALQPWAGIPTRLAAVAVVAGTAFVMHRFLRFVKGNWGNSR